MTLLHKIRHLVRVCLFGGIAILLSTMLVACSLGGSMQVEVEVYKGPLSKEPAAQWGELLGLIEHINFVLPFSVQQLNLTMGSALGYSDATSAPGGLTSDQLKFYVWRSCWAGNTKENREICTRYTAMKESAKAAQAKAEKLLGRAQDCDKKLEALLATGDVVKANDVKVRQVRACYQRVLRRAIAFANALTVGGFVVAESHVPFASKDRTVRSFQVSFANLTSEFGNQIASRADSLLKQMRGEDRRVMPVSIYLRDAKQTDFLNLFVWNHAGALSLCEEGCSNVEEVTRDRVRTVERLFADHNWARINSVFASGQGDVRMAFIKDDIGNWNLKNFDNDPTELLQTYKQAGLAVIKTVSDLAKPGGLSGAERVLNFGNRLALGQGSGEEIAAESKTLKALHSHTLSRLVALESDIVKRKNALAQAIPAKQAELAQQKKAKEKLEKEIEEERKKRPEGTPEALMMEADIAAGREKEAREVVKNTQGEIKTLEETPPSGTTLEDQARHREKINAQIESLKKVIDKENEAAQKFQNEANTKKAQADQIVKLDVQIASKVESLAALAKQVDQLENDLKRLEVEEATLAETARDDTRRILDDYSDLIDGLFEASTSSERRTGLETVQEKVKSATQ